MPDEIRLLLATHTYGKVMPAFAVSLAQTTAHLTRLGITHGVMMFQDSLVDRGRDRAAAETLAAGYTHLLFIDGDVEFTPDCVTHLLKARKPVIGGALPLKDASGNFTVGFLEGPVQQCPESKAVKVARIGAGFLMISREALEQFAAAYPEISYTEQGPQGTRPMRAYFEHVVRDGIRWSEDYSFCERWRAAGGDVWLSPFLEFGHWGSQVWRGSVLSKFKRV